MDYKQTLVVNLFAGPGAGKSTTCSGVFFELKSKGINCEIASEYAKDLVWEKRHSTFDDQIYLFAKQYHRIFRLLNQVDVIITDCPILLSPVYDPEKRILFEQLVVEEHMKMWTLNIFLHRTKKYNPKGRIHSENQATDIDIRVASLLHKYDIFTVGVEGNGKGKDVIVEMVTKELINKGKL